MAFASVNNLSELKAASKDYLRYSIKKDKIKQKYTEDIFPCYTAIGTNYSTKRPTQKQREDYKKYLKEIADLIFKPNGDYQKFCWNFLTPPAQKQSMSLIANGRKNRKLEY